MRRIKLSICGIIEGKVSETLTATLQRKYETLVFESDMDSEDHSFSKKTLIKVPTAEITVSSFNVKKQLFSPNSIDVTLTCTGTDNKSLAIIDHIKNFLSKATVNLNYEGIDILRNYFVFSAKVNDYNDTEFTMSFTAYSADKILTLPSLSMSYTNRCITDIADYFVNFNDEHYSYAKELDNIFKKYGYELYFGQRDFGKGNLLIAPGKRNKNKFQHLSERDTTTIDNYKTDRTHPTLIQSRESPYDFLCRVCYENGEYFFYEDSKMRFGSGHYHDNLTGNTLSLKDKELDKVKIKDITSGFNEANPELFANSILINNYIGGTYTKTDGNSDDGDDDITSGTVDKKITIYFNDVAKKYMTGDGLVLEPHMHKPEQDSPIEKYKVFDDRIEIYDYDDKKRNTSGELHLKMRFDANGEQIDKDNASGTYWSIQKKYYIIPYGFTPKEVKLDSATEEGTKKAKHGFNPSIYIYKDNKNWEKPYLQIDFILVGKPEPKPQPQPKPKPQEIIDPSDPKYNNPFEAYESPISINAESITSCEEFLKYNDSSKLNLDQSHTAMLAEKHYKKPVAWIPRIGNLLGQYRLKSAVMKVLTDMSLSFGISLLKAAIAGTDKTFKKRKEHQKIQFNTSKNYNIDTYSELLDSNKCEGDEEKPKSPQNEKVTKPISPRTKAETRVDAFNGNKEAHDKLVTLKSQNLYCDIRLGNYFLYRQVFKDSELERGIFCANAVDFEYSSAGYSMTIKAVRRAKVSLMSSDQKKFASDATDEISDSHWCPGIIPPFLSAGSGENGATNGRRIMPNGQNQLVNNTIRIATVVETKGETSSVVKEKVIETTDDGKEIPKIKEDITSLNNNFALGLKKNDCENGTTNTDPLAMGRVRVTFDDEYNAMPSELMPVAKPANGFNFTPRIGDKVLVAYAYGDPDKPFVLCDISANSLGWAYSEKSAVQSRNGHKITFDDPIKGSGWGELLGSILPLPFLSELFSKVIPDASNKDWSWKNGGITMTDGLGIYKVSMDSGKRNISISSPLGDISLNSLTGIKISAPKGDLNLEGYNINLTAGNNVNITSGKAIVDTSGEHFVKEELEDFGLDLAKAIAKQFVDFTMLRFVVRVIFQPVEGSICITSPRNILISNGKALDFKDVNSKQIDALSKKSLRDQEKLKKIILALGGCFSLQKTMYNIQEEAFNTLEAIRTALYEFKTACVNNNGQSLLNDANFWGDAGATSIALNQLYDDTGAYKKNDGIGKNIRRLSEILHQNLSYEAELANLLKNDINSEEFNKVKSAAKVLKNKLATNNFSDTIVHKIIKANSVDDMKKIIQAKYPGGEQKFNEDFNENNNQEYEDITNPYWNQTYVLGELKQNKKVRITNTAPDKRQLKPEGLNNFTDIVKAIKKAVPKDDAPLLNYNRFNSEYCKEKNIDSIDDINSIAEKKDYLKELVKFALKYSSKTKLFDAGLDSTGLSEIIDTVKEAWKNDDWRIMQGPFGIGSTFMNDKEKKFKNKLKPRIYFGTSGHTRYINDKGELAKDQYNNDTLLQSITNFIDSLPNNLF